MPRAIESLSDDERRMRELAVAPGHDMVAEQILNGEDVGRRVVADCRGEGLEHRAGVKALDGGGAPVAGTSCATNDAASGW